jgi:hypothetical protein
VVQKCARQRRLRHGTVHIGPDKPAPDPVNPSLWRNAQLNMYYGLFKVTDHIYEARGYDLSNVTFIQGDSGWIVCDPLISAETAKAAYNLVTQYLGQRPIVAVVYSRSHIDQYGGARGIKIPIIAPDQFTEEATAKNVLAGNAMGRRAIYVFGALLPRNATGDVNGRLGQTNSIGTTGLIVPTDKKMCSRIALNQLTVEQAIAACGSRGRVLTGAIAIKGESREHARHHGCCREQHCKKQKARDLTFSLMRELEGWGTSKLGVPLSSRAKRTQAPKAQ